MTITTAPSINADEIRQMRCAHLKELLEPWSIRRLATRTGLTKAAVEAIYTGKRELSMSDIEVIAPVLRMTPEELFVELLELDSNQQPAG